MCSICCCRSWTTARLPTITTQGGFRHVIIVMTTNAGAFEMSRPSIGFTQSDSVRMQWRRSGAVLSGISQSSGCGHQFGNLDQDTIERVVDKLLIEAEAQLEQKRVSSPWTSRARWIAKRGYDRRWEPADGAHHPGVHQATAGRGAAVRQLVNGACGSDLERGWEKLSSTPKPGSAGAAVPREGQRILGCPRAAEATASVDDAAFGQVVGGHLDRDLVAGQAYGCSFCASARNVGGHEVAGLEFDAKRRIGRVSTTSPSN